jgi:hypothetical protein
VDSGSGACRSARGEGGLLRLVLVPVRGGGVLGGAVEGSGEQPGNKGAEGGRGRRRGRGWGVASALRRNGGRGQGDQAWVGSRYNNHEHH